MEFYLHDHGIHDAGTCRSKLQDILKSQKGKSNLKIVVLDMLSENYLSLISEEYKVEVNTTLLDHVKELGFDFILN